MLVPIHLPDELMVSCCCDIEVRNPAEVPCRRFGAAIRILSPSYLRAVIKGLAENRNATEENFIRSSDEIAGVLRVAEGLSDLGRIGKNRQGQLGFELQVRRRDRQQSVGNFLA